MQCQSTDSDRLLCAFRCLPRCSRGSKSKHGLVAFERKGHERIKESKKEQAGRSAEWCEAASEFTEKRFKANQLAVLCEAIDVEYSPATVLEDDDGSVGHIYSAAIDELTISLDDRKPEPLGEQLADGLRRLSEEFESYAHTVEERMAKGSDRWAVVVRHEDERPDVSAVRVRQYRSALSFKRRLERDGLAEANTHLRRACSVE